MISNIKLLKKESVADGTMAFHFSKPEGFDFRAGQFADFTLIDPVETDEEGNTRAFSLVQAPDASEIIIATRMRNTAYKRVLTTLPMGADVKMEGAYGDYTLHKTQSTPAVFIIGGIGVTPVHSMIAQATLDKTDHKITLIHASGTPAQLPYKASFKALSKENPNFNYVKVASDSAPADWTGERGWVDADMVKKYVSDLTTPIYYLSGPEGMVKAMRKLLIELNVNEDNIRTEEFPGY